MKWERMRKLAAALTAAALAVAGTPAAVSADEADGNAKGRYMESEISLPEECDPLGIIRKEDGTLRVAVQNAEGGIDLWDSSDLGAAWEKNASLPESVRDLYVTEIALRRDGGGIFTGMDVNADDYKDVLVSFDAGGEANFTDFSGASFRNFIFSKSGVAAGVKSGGGAWTIDPETGEEQTQLGSSVTVRLGVCGEEALLVTAADVERYDLQSGEPLGRDEALGEALYAGGRSYEDIYGQGHELVFAEDEEGRLYYCSHDGIYVHTVGGNTVEQVVDGTLTSLTNPSVVPVAMETAEGVIFVICADSEGRMNILAYTYDPDVASVPDEELTVWSLRESDGMRQAIAAFQKENPNIYVNYEIGISGSDGVTVSDATRTLNTDILAGNGPDLLVLDGLSVETYAGKGFLRDLSGLLSEIEAEDGLFENAAYTWKNDSGVCAVPLHFGVSLAVGRKELLEELTDIDSLTELANEPQLLDFSTAIELPEILYYTTAGSWMRDDRTIDEDALRRYVGAVRDIYSRCVENQSEEDRERYLNDDDYFLELKEFYESSGLAFGDLAVETTSMLGGSAGLYPGFLMDMMEYSMMTSAVRQLDGYGMQLFGGSGEHFFMPLTTVGLAENGRNPEAAENFLRYLLSQEGAKQYSTYGFSVNRAALHDMIFVDQFGESGGMYLSSENAETGEMVSLESKWPTEEELTWLMEQIETLDRRTESEAVQMDAVTEETRRCMYGEISVDEAVESILQKVNLYLAEVAG